MTFGILTFLNPWLLAGLVSLPLIYWLLRTVPPRPKQIEFPPTRILKEVKSKEKTPAKTPWWLLLIRLLAAALIIVALAEPVINPAQKNKIDGTGPLAIIIDNGWPSAANWERRLEKIDRLIGSAQSSARPVILIPTATLGKNIRSVIQSPSQARTTARGLIPLPFPPNLSAAVKALRATLSANPTTKNPASKPNIVSPDGISIVWLTDGIDHGKNTAQTIEQLSNIAKNGSFHILKDENSDEPLGLATKVTTSGRLKTIIKRTSGARRTGTVTAFSARSENLAQANFLFKAGQTETSLTFDIPLELRNLVARVTIDAQRSAGAVALLDARSKWRRVALVSSQDAESAQPLLAPLYYLEKALIPYAQIIKPGNANTLATLEDAFKKKADVIIMADIGTLSQKTTKRVAKWVSSGGILIRFAGPRMEKAADKLLPVPLRIGGRTLGGALSWSTPQKLSPFEDDSPFAGLKTSPEITISRQVLADPARLSPSTHIWARLEDGTPLVTSSKRGDGEIILFHITANSDWSNLPMSGLFVEMLKRILARGNSHAIETSTIENKNNSAPHTPTGNTPSASTETSALLPIQTLNGFGELQPPTPNAQAIKVSEFTNTKVSPDHPPGYYGSAGTPRALNIVGEKTVLRPLPELPTGITVSGYGTKNEKPLKPNLLAAALALIFLDMLAILYLQGFGSRSTFARASSAPKVLMLAFLIAASGITLFSGVFVLISKPVMAQDNSETKPLDPHAQQATNRVTLGYVLTGDSQTDTTSRQGLEGLGRVLSRRTSVTPGTPIGVDIVKDEIAFYPILYWPLRKNARELPEKVLAKIDAYMKQGGLIVFDTKDFGQGRPTGFPQSSDRKTPLQRLLGKLDIPRLEPVPPGHVLTKSFYLLHEFPGRWAGGQLWVEAGAGSGNAGPQRTTRTDGVTSIMITSNDFASAWAMDERGRPLYPLIGAGGRQREMAFRTGINIVMHALTGNYKADQVHIPSLLQRLGQ